MLLREKMGIFLLRSQVERGEVAEGMEAEPVGDKVVCPGRLVCGGETC